MALNTTTQQLKNNNKLNTTTTTITLKISALDGKILQ